MRKIFSATCNFVANTKKKSIILGIFAVAFCSVILLSNTTGPAKQRNTVTGAPFDNSQTCAKSGCHGGGNFGGTIVTQLLDASNNIVTAYTPGVSYTLKITMNSTTAPKGYGFQTAAATVGTNTNINTWGTLIADYHNQAVSGRNYVEQSKRLSQNTISIPWTGPFAGTGSVIFYTAGNLVNGNSSTTGDQPVNTNLTVSEAGALPIKLLYFKGSIQSGKAVLSWATTQETSNKNFIIEKSLDGINYTPLSILASKGNSTNGSAYSFTDAGFFSKAFYRLKQIDADGNTTTYNIVELKNAVASDYKISIYAHAGASYILFYNGLQQQKINVQVADLQGKKIYSYNTSVNQGDNQIQLPSNIRGIIIVTIITEDGRRTSAKVGIMQ